MMVDVIWLIASSVKVVATLSVMRVVCRQRGEWFPREIRIDERRQSHELIG
jgi:hypothetical protein